MARPGDLPVHAFESAGAWEAWLDANHAASPGVWLELAKKGSGLESVTYAEAVEVALCFGWIDGRKASGDDRRWYQRFTPRRPTSPWSKLNRAKAEQLVAAGRMREAGQRAVDEAKADGRWDAAYDSQRSASVPEDLRAALDADAAAAAEFDRLDSRNRYAVLYRVQTAKRADTRARRIAQLVAMLAKGERLYP